MLNGTGLLGIQLQLALGQTQPAPAAENVVRALSRVDVQSDAGAGDGFQITFSVARDQLGSFPLLSGDDLAPMHRCVISVLFGVVPTVLIDGIITNREFNPARAPASSTLTVTGQDLSLLLDLKERNEKYESQWDSAIVNRILANYAQYGLVAQSQSTEETPNVNDRIPRQFETDLKFINRLAQRNGYVFYIEPLLLGISRAYFGPENRQSVPHPPLTINMGSADNVRAMRFSHNALAPVDVQGSYLDLSRPDKPSVPVTPPQLPGNPLARERSASVRTRLLRHAAHLDKSQADALALGVAAEAEPPIVCQGELDVVSYGDVLRPNHVVGVRGAGHDYDGKYLVRSVKHQIERGKYSQSFTLTREGTGALSQVLPL